MRRGVIRFTFKKRRLRGCARDAARVLLMVALLGTTLRAQVVPSAGSSVAARSNRLRLVAGQSRLVSWRGGDIRSARIVRIAPAVDFPFVLASDAEGGNAELRVAVPPTTPPGDYTVEIANGDLGQAAMHLSVTVDAMVVPRATANRPPVVLLNGWQPVCLGENLDSTVTGSTGTFGQLAALLQADGASVAFFNNCAYGNVSIELLGLALKTYLANLRYPDGTPVTEVDLVAHSMGGLIARSFLSGKLAGTAQYLPPSEVPIRKLIMIATPHFGSFQAVNAGVQSPQMVPGSQFLWDLATWKQGTDDLRGVDMLAIVGSAGTVGTAQNASDGVVSLTSASLRFAAPDQRTRIVPYCHTGPGVANLAMSCTGAAGIAKVSSTAHLTGRIVRSFLAGTADWQTIGSSPSQNPYLASYGAAMFQLVDTNGQCTQT